MYPLNTYLQPHNLEENQFEDVDTCRSKDEVIEAPDQDTFLSHFHRAQYFSQSSLDDAHNAIWGNSMMHCSASLAARRMSCERLLQEAGLINLSSSVPMSNSRKRKAEIIEVHGAGGRKDKHSKVCTARGTRDRRVRLSPRTAIEFYDVQDRLGYDRPSKAIDWLIKEAKTAIDALEEQQLLPLGSDHNQWSADHHGKLQTVSESGIVQKQEDLDHDDNHVSSFGFFLNTTASPIFHGDGFHPSGNQSSALENEIPNPGYQPGFISGLATNPQIFDKTWEVARLQRVLTVTEDSDNARASGVLEYTSPNYLPLRFQALPIPAGNNQGFCQAETTLQSGIINYSPISISFPGFCLSNELSNVAAAAILKDGANEKTDLSKTPAFLQYHKGGISG